MTGRAPTAPAADERAARAVVIDVHGGTPEAVWASSLRALPPLTGLPQAGRVVLVAPHPDDEVLGCGGLMVALGRAGLSVEVVAVTDGEAAHPSLAPNRRAALGAARRAEAAEADRRLGMEVRRHWLALADGDVGGGEADLVERLAGVLSGVPAGEPAVLCVAPFAADGHPDHEACGRAAWAAAARLGTRLLTYPVWAWHWARPGDFELPLARARCLPLDGDQVERKARAIAAHRSQLEASGPAAPDGPVLSEAVLAHFRRPFEVFLT